MAELQRRITYRECAKWLTFIVEEEQRPTKNDYYLAQIAAEIRRGLVKKPNEVKVKDFLISFEKEGTVVPKPGSKSKSIWMAGLGIKTPKGK